MLGSHSAVHAPFHVAAATFHRSRGVLFCVTRSALFDWSVCDRVKMIIVIIITIIISIIAIVNLTSPLWLGGLRC